MEYPRLRSSSSSLRASCVGAIDHCMRARRVPAGVPGRRRRRRPCSSSRLHPRTAAHLSSHAAAAAALQPVSDVIWAYVATDALFAWQRAAATSAHRDWRNWSELRPAPTDGHLITPTVAGLPGLCENFRPTASKS